MVHAKNLVAVRSFLNLLIHFDVKSRVMPSKYDTNPLDPDFPEKARAAAAGDETQTLPYRGGETRPFPAETATTDEQQTRRFAEAEVNAYSAPYTPPYNG